MSLSRQQFTLIGIFALFFGPLILVMLMRSSWWQYQPSGMKNLGLLVQPPQQITLERTAETSDKWLILSVLDEPCEQGCVEKTAALRQVHRAAGRHADHLEVVLLSQASMTPELRSNLEAVYPAFNIMDGSKTLNATLLDINTSLGETPSGLTDINTFILDPMSNVVLAYPAEANPGDLLKDLKRLLKWSDQEK
ncbi:MAG: hypothetical protein KJN61_00480 [Gammaproteobacteria bacterium]|nr:hypothetical protein [Gammaproteobacteria bacterium]MBT8074916.1 hypothetical protein [Gammaproteobacteria bacterium]NNL00082.1 hypothetical protein [Xanthomonadales bacterium]